MGRKVRLERPERKEGEEPIYEKFIRASKERKALKEMESMNTSTSEDEQNVWFKPIKQRLEKSREKPIREKREKKERKVRLERPERSEETEPIYEKFIRASKERKALKEM